MQITITARRAPNIARFKLEVELNMPDSFSDPANVNDIDHELCSCSC